MYVDLTHLRNLTDTHRQLACRTSKMASQTIAQSNQRHLYQHMAKWSIPTHQKPSTPFDSTLQTTCLPRSRHTERHDVRSRAACLSQEMAAENSRGAWARISLTSSTQTSPAKNNCVPTLTSEWRSSSALAVPHACDRRKRSQIIFRRFFPIELPQIET